MGALDADPTRIDPPIAFNVPLALDPHRNPDHARALRALNALHGRPDGVPLSEQPTPEHQEATWRLLAGRRVTVLLTHVAADGTPTFALYARPRPARP